MKDFFSPGSRVRIYSNESTKHKFTTLNLRWLDWIFLKGYLPSLSINYASMSKDMGKRLPQLH